MILIKGLTKKYKSKNRRICTALDNINLSLPDSGMIFIIGKSGSGKSTLLNMIGGLDSFDGGDIIAGGNSLSRFGNTDFYKYRASFVGFIFQDYHLLDELTISENIALEAEIANCDNVDIDAALKSVDLESFGQRYPDELSGGQKQRVAIARALIKSPGAILCDEPTGNLDNNTSRQIMDLLKEISRDRLVLIVSHNMADAQKYADRIIELADGRVISDISRRQGYSNEITINDGTLTIPYNHNLTENETDLISDGISTGNIVKIKQNDSGYETTPDIPDSDSKIRFYSSGMKFKSIAKLFASFSRIGRLRTAITALICTVMVVLLIILQSYLMFDSSNAIKQSSGSDGDVTVVLKKDTYIDEYGNMNQTKIYKVTDDDLSKIDELSGGTARKYLLYNNAIPVNLKNRPRMVESETAFSFIFEGKHIYTPQMPGVLVCDLDYLTGKFGNDGELTVLAGDINDCMDGAGVIITDYTADAMMMYNPMNFRSYDDVICSIDDESNHVWGSIIAVVETGYKEKYADLIELVRESDGDKAGINALNKDTAVKILDDIKNNLSIGYSLNPDFHSEAAKEENKNYARLTSHIIEAEGGTFTEIVDGTTVSENYTGINLNDGEITLSLAAMRELFPEISNDLFTFPVNINIKRYEYPNRGGEVLYNKNFTVIGITNYITMSEKDFLDLKKVDIIPYAVYVENADNISNIIDGMSDNYFSWNSTEGTAITLLNKSVNMFFELFRMIEIMVLVIAVMFIISHSVRSVKSNYYQIGVIKAIGGRSFDIAKIFVAQNILLSLSISLLTIVGSVIFIDVANNIIIKSFTAITGSSVGDITIISFDLVTVLSAVLVVILISLIATAVPLIMLNKIKPINIIKAKE